MDQYPARIEFKVKTPVPQKGLRANISWAMRKGFPEVQEGRERDDVVNIIANGPSALEAPLDGLTVALNGALGVFARNDVVPTWWAGCDPQPLMATFLQEPPVHTTYLVASKCDRSVFEALKWREIRLWHVDDTPGHKWAVPTATSITLTAMSLLRRMGYRRFRTWGWDACYLDGMDHAIPQPHRGDEITVYVNDRPFRTTGTWALEAQDAVNQLSGADYEVQIEGPGMVGAIVRALCPESAFRVSSPQPGMSGN